MTTPVTAAASWVCLVYAAATPWQSKRIHSRTHSHALLTVCVSRRYVGVVGDALCARCDGSIESWERSAEENRARLARHAWCSWCVEPSRHQRVQTNVLARHVYRCDNCQQRTLVCISCQE